MTSQNVADVQHAIIGFIQRYALMQDSLHSKDKTCHAGTEHIMSWRLLQITQWQSLDVCFSHKSAAGSMLMHSRCGTVGHTVFLGMHRASLALSAGPVLQA